MFIFPKYLIDARNNKIGKKFNFNKTTNSYKICGNDCLLFRGIFSFKELVKFNTMYEIYSAYNSKQHQVSIDAWSGTDLFQISIFDHDYEDIKLSSGIYETSYDKEHDYCLIKKYVASKVNFLSNPPINLKKDYDEYINSNNKTRGLLLYGPPGNGKTQSILNLISNVDAVVLISKDFNTFERYKYVIEKLKPILIFEEIQCFDSESMQNLLNFLDGINSFEYSYCIATTNYPDRLEQNLVSRPGRFQKCIEFKNPTTEHIKEYLQTKFNNIEGADILTGLSWDFIAQICKNISHTSEIENEYLKIKEEFRYHSNNFKKSIGFN